MLEILQVDSCTICTVDTPELNEIEHCCVCKKEVNTKKESYAYGWGYLYCYGCHLKVDWKSDENPKPIKKKGFWERLFG